MDSTLKNLAPLQPSKFQVAIARIPTVSYFCQKVHMPALFMTGDLKQPTPFIDAHIPGDKMEHEPLSMTFIVDEMLYGWEELAKWLKGITFPKDFAQYRDLNKLSRVVAASPKPQYSDMTVIINSTMNNPRIRICFFECFPIYISEIVMDTTSSADNTMICTAQFNFRDFDIERV